VYEYLSRRCRELCHPVRTWLWTHGYTANDQGLIRFDETSICDLFAGACLAFHQQMDQRNGWAGLDELYVQCQASGSASKIAVETACAPTV